MAFFSELYCHPPFLPHPYFFRNFTLKDPHQSNNVNFFRLKNLSNLHSGYYLWILHFYNLFEDDCIFMPNFKLLLVILSSVIKPPS